MAVLDRVPEMLGDKEFGGRGRDVEVEGSAVAEVRLSRWYYTVRRQRESVE